MPKKWYAGISELRGLPSGYTQLAHIQSSGTQYINTGFIPNNNTKAICDAELLSGTNDISVPFGTYESGSNRFALMYHHQLGWTHWVGGASGQCSGAQLGRHTFTLTGTSLIVDSATKTFTTAAFTGSVPMFIFGINYTGHLDYAASMRLYSCKIYDNGALVRDFVPCKNANGVVGLYDMVNGVFYANAGTGVFTAGSTISGSVAREVKKPYINASNADRKGKKGYIGVDGVARLFFQSGIPIGELDVGTSVWVNINGVPVEFVIVNQGIPSNSSLYDASCNGTWLLTKNIYETRALHASRTTNYASTNIHSYFNNEFLALFDSGVQSAIKQVKIPYNGGTGANGLSTKIFLLGNREVGFGQINSNQPKDGDKLSWFTSDNSSRIAYYNGTATIWFTRSPSTDTFWHVRADGYIGGNYANNAQGIRPAFVVDYETPVDPATYEILT